MNRFDMLACPGDKKKLVFFPDLSIQSEGEEEGVLLCQACEQAWTIMSGIPRFVTPANPDICLDISFLKKEVGRNRIPDSILEKNIERLKKWQTKNRSGWQSEEMDYWDHHYRRSLPSDKKNKRPLMTYNRFLPRQKYILEPLNEVPISRVLEIGCGKATTMAMSPLFLVGKEYVGTDLSFQALLSAKKGVAGLFIVCAAEALPFADNSFDLVLNFGILHHLPERESGLLKILSVLKPGGWVGIAEKCRMPEKAKKSFLLKMIRGFLQKWFQPRHKEAEYVDLDNLLSILAREGSDLRMHLEYSLVRDILVGFFVDLLRINLRWLTRLFIFLDERAIGLLGKRFALFYPKNCLVLSRKR